MQRSTLYKSQSLKLLPSHKIYSGNRQTYFSTVFVTYWKSHYLYVTWNRTQIIQFIPNLFGEEVLRLGKKFWRWPTWRFASAKPQKVRMAEYHFKTYLVCYKLWYHLGHIRWESVTFSPLVYKINNSSNVILKILQIL